MIMNLGAGLCTQSVCVCVKNDSCSELKGISASAKGISASARVTDSVGG